MSSAIVEKISNLITPIVLNLGYELYHIEYVNESNDYYLRVYINNENGIKLTDCETVSRAISDMLDEKDPIEEAYYLEVSSPGLDRPLHTDKHLESSIGETVKIKLRSNYEGKKMYEGTLKSFSIENINIDVDNLEVLVPREKIKSMNVIGKI